MQDGLWSADQWGLIRLTSNYLLHSSNLGSTLSRFREVNIFFVCASLDVWSYYRNSIFYQSDIKLLRIAPLGNDHDLHQKLPFERLLWWIVRNVENHKRNSLGYKCLCMRPLQVSSREGLVMSNKNLGVIFNSCAFICQLIDIRAGQICLLARFTPYIRVKIGDRRKFGHRLK